MPRAQRLSEDSALHLACALTAERRSVVLLLFYAALPAAPLLRCAKRLQAPGGWHDGAARRARGGTSTLLVPPEVREARAATRAATRGRRPSEELLFSLKGGGRRRFRLFGAGTLVWLLNLACVHPYRLRQGAGAGQSQPACNSSRGTCQPLGGQHCHWQVQRASLTHVGERPCLVRAYVVEFVVEI